MVTDWLHEAENLEEIDRLERGAWHPFRCKWAIDRKGLPAVDVAQAGVWAHPDTVRLVHQKANAQTTRAAMFHKKAER